MNDHDLSPAVIEVAGYYISRDRRNSIRKSLSPRISEKKLLRSTNSLGFFHLQNSVHFSRNAWKRERAVSIVSSLSPNEISFLPFFFLSRFFSAKMPRSINVGEGKAWNTDGNERGRNNTRLLEITPIVRRKESRVRRLSFRRDRRDRKSWIGKLTDGGNCLLTG